MRNKIMIWSLSGMMVLGMTASAVAQAESGVYVDLSALDSLDAGDSMSINSQPLFPVIKKSPAKTKPAVRKKTPAKRKTAAKSKVDVSVAKPDINMLSAPEKSSKDDLFKNAPAEVKDTTSAAPVVPIKVQTEELPAPEVVSNNVVADSTVPVAPVQPAPIPFIDDGKPVQVVDVEPVVTPAVDVATPTATSSSMLDANAVSTPISAPVVPAEVVPAVEEPTVENAPVIAGPVNRQLVYSSEVADMSSEQQMQVDRIIASFSDAHANKIAIYAYNLDDGVDTFKKKRISLNRAVDVRGYLLKKGFKNFSIKVINVEPNSDKVNVVEIEELK